MRERKGLETRMTVGERVVLWGYQPCETVGHGLFGECQSEGSGSHDAGHVESHRPGSLFILQTVLDEYPSVASHSCSHVSMDGTKRLLDRLRPCQS